MAEKVEVVIKIPKHYLTHPQDYICLAECVRRGTPLPKGHGDLVDRDRVIDLLNEQEYNYYTQLDKVCDTVYDAPTIIEADGGGEYEGSD